MSTSLETRVPFLDLDVINTATRIPLAFNIDGSKGKLPLRSILNKYVPSELIDRPKSGFAIPIGAWLKGSLREWAESLLNENSIKNDGLLNYNQVRKLWDQHLSGKSDLTPQIWSILMFQSWLKEIKSSI